MPQITTTGNAPGRKMNARQLASVLSRFQGPEQFYQQAFTPLTSPVIPNNLNLTRPCESIDIWWLGRVVIGTANYSSIAAEAPQNILQKVVLQGTHKVLNQIIPINMSGATIFAWPRLLQSHGNAMLINGVLQSEPGVPFAQTLSNFGNTGTYDIAIQYNIPFAPLIAPQSRRSENFFLLDPNAWVGQSLQLQLFFGDQSSFGVPGGSTTVTFSAFGSGSGNPLVYIYQNFAILGPAANSINSGVIIRNEQAVIGGSVSALQTGIRLALLQKQKTTMLVLKTGINQTTVSSGVNVYASLTDAMLERTRLIVDNKPVKNNNSNLISKYYHGRMFNTIVPQGYLAFPFEESQTPLTYFRADTAQGGTTFELDTDVIQANANQQASFVQEQVLGVPSAKGASAT